MKSVAIEIFHLEDSGWILRILTNEARYVEIKITDEDAQRLRNENIPVY